MENYVIIMKKMTKKQTKQFRNKKNEKINKKMKKCVDRLRRIEYNKIIKQIHIDNLTERKVRTTKNIR